MLVDVVIDLPLDLLSMLLPEGMAIVHVPSGIDYDEFASGCLAFMRAKEAAHHPESECGRDIGPGEQCQLSAKVVSLRGRAA